MRTLLILLAAVAVIAVLSHELTGSKKFGKNDAQKIGKNTIIGMLNSPSTAKFPGMFEDGQGAFRRSDGLWEAYGWVDAQNGFGAVTREDWRVVLDEKKTVFFAKLGSQVVGEMPGLPTSGAKVSIRNSSTSRSEKEIRAQWGWDTSGTSLNRPAHSKR